MTLHLTPAELKERRIEYNKRYRQSVNGKRILAACNKKYYHKLKIKKKEAMLLLPAIFTKLTPEEIKTIEILI
jgi:hypothetical protein